MGVAEQQRPPGADQVEIAVAIDVGHVTSVTSCHEARHAADGAEGADGRVDPSRGHCGSPVEEHG
jgi:hypothetical protein